MTRFFAVFSILLVAAQAATFDPSLCGIKKACSLLKDANGMGFAYSMISDTIMDIEIFGKSATTTGFYFAVGFSTDDMMGDESVIECSSLGTDPISLKFSYNAGQDADHDEPSNVRIDNYQQYSTLFSNPKYSSENGSILCSARVNVGGDADPKIFKYDASTPYYFLMANGVTSNTGFARQDHALFSAIPSNMRTFEAAQISDTVVTTVDPIVNPSNCDQCGVTKNCFFPQDKDSCTGFGFTYKMVGPSLMEVELMLEQAGMLSYVAVGFSRDNAMGSDSVIECSQLQNQALSMKFSYNDDQPKNVRISGEDAIRPTMITDTSISTDNGYLYCRAVVNVGGYAGNTQVFNMTDNPEYYLLMAVGATKADGLSYHGAFNRMVSNAKVDLTTKPDANLAGCDQCGVTKNCFFPQDSAKCTGWGFTYKMVGPSLMEVELMMQRSGTANYVAVGFASSTMMGNQSVIECSQLQNQPLSMKFSYNDADPKNVRIDGELAIRAAMMTNTFASADNGNLYCRAVINVDGSSGNPKIFSMSANPVYYLLMAVGQTDVNGLLRHGADGHAASSMVDVTANPAPNFGCDQCGVTKNCFFPTDPTTCTGWGFTHKMVGPSLMEVELMMQPSGTSNYVAVAFARSTMMGNQSVIECSQLQNKELSMKFSYNDADPKNVRIDGEPTIRATYITDTYASTANGNIYCRGIVHVDGSPGHPEIFSMTANPNYYLLMAVGQTDANGLLAHGPNGHAASPTTVDLTAYVGSTPTAPPPTTVGTTPVGTTIAASTNFGCDQCGVTKNCFFPQGQTTCTGYGFTYKMVGPNLMEMELMLQPSGTSNYVAVGFSRNNMMGDQSVIECSQLQNQPLSMKFSYNDADPKNVRIDGEPDIRALYITNTYASTENGQIYCRGTVNVSGTAANSEIFNVTDNPVYYLLMAVGPTNADGLLVHTAKTASPTKFDLTAPVGSTPTAPPPTTMGTTIAPATNFGCDQCGVSKNCFFPQGQTTCTGYGFTYKMVGPNLMEMELMLQPSGTSNYVAVGFSRNNMMGDQSVIECSQLQNKELSMKFSYNDADPKNVRIAGEPEIRALYITDTYASTENGQLYCRGTVNVAGSAVNSKIFNMTNNPVYYLLMAVGPTSASRLLVHTSKTASPTTVDLTAPVGSTPTAPPPTTMGTTTIGTTIAPSTNFGCDQCGVTKNCFFPQSPRTCTGYGFTYKMVGTNLMEMELMLQPSGTSNYVAVAFSRSNMMGNQSVIECSQLQNQPLSMKFSYNNGAPSNVRIAGEPTIRATYITKTYASTENGQIYCRGTVNVAGSATNSEIFNITDNPLYYLFMAVGPTNADGLLIHSAKTASSTAIDLTAPVASLPPPTTGGTTTVGTTMDASLNPAGCSQCKKTKSCFFPQDEDGCTGWGFTYRMTAPTLMEIELMMQTTATANYIAVGFSRDGQMGNASVIECSQFVNQPLSLKFSYNTDQHKNLRIDDEATISKAMITNTSTSTEDGNMYCRGIVNVTGWTGNAEVFSMTADPMYYLLLAVGQTTTTSISYHGADKTATPAMVNLTSTAAPMPTAGPTTPAPTQNPNSTMAGCDQCGVTKSCFFPKDQSKCTGYGFTYKMVNAALMEMELMAPTGTSNYVAIGFSRDSNMGSESVIECSTLANQDLSMKFSYNDGAPKNVRITGEPAIRQQMITSPTVLSQDGNIYCRGIVNVTGWAGNSQIFSMTTNPMYYLLLAVGPTDGNGLRYHGSEGRTVSGSLVNLTAITSIAKKGGMSEHTRQNLRVAHGILMLLAWLCFIPTAVLFARFLRNSWPLVKPGGLLIWFHVHRTANLFGILLTVAAFILIMTANDWQWTGPGSKRGKWSQVHTMTGLAALILAWLQPFISAMRCTPNNPKRPMFNWIHRGIGMTAFILATTTMAIAAYHFDPMWTQMGVQLALVLLPISIICVLCVVIPVMDHLQSKSVSDSHYQTLEFIRQVLVLCSIGLITADAIALAVMLGMN